MPMLVLSGPPGAGKTTAAHAAAERLHRSVLWHGDLFWGCLTEQVEPWLPEAHEQNATAVRAAAAAVGTYARGGYDALLEGVFGPWYLDQLAAGAAEVVFDYALLLPDVETVAERVIGRGESQPVPDDAVRSTHANFSKAVAERDLERHVLRSRTSTPDETVDEILRRRDAGELRYSG